MTVVICPGIHSPQLTESFLAGLAPSPTEVLVFPADRYPAYSGCHILQFLEQQLRPTPPRPALLFIAFSAGVVGAIAAAHLWQVAGGQVKALLALDGWGVPLYGPFPIHRLSHDYFTHWSSQLLGSGQDSFYAEPPIQHLALWSAPQAARGRWLSSSLASSADGQTAKITAAQFLLALLTRYGEGEATMKLEI